MLWRRGLISYLAAYLLQAINILLQTDLVKMRSNILRLFRERLLSFVNNVRNVKFLIPQQACRTRRETLQKLLLMLQITNF